MSMNIKDEAVHAMAKEIARETGESITEVVRTALSERKQRLGESNGRNSASWKEVCAVLDRIHALPKFGPPIDHGDLLYGDDGLPK